MSEKKVIEQDNCQTIELSESIYHIRIDQTYEDGSENYIIIAKTQATEVAKAIDERYQKIEELLERGRVLLHSCTFDDHNICESAKKDINDFYSEIESLNQTT